jgi:hypothetical protein
MEGAETEGRGDGGRRGGGTDTLGYSEEKEEEKA